MLAYFLFLISKEDIKTRLIPDEYSLAIAILAVGLGGFSIFRVDLALLITILTSQLMGFGDAKLFGALSLFFGSHILLIIFLSFLSAGIYCIFCLITKTVSLKSSIPFAPFISCASLAVYIPYFAKEVLKF